MLTRRGRCRWGAGDYPDRVMASQHEEPAAPDALDLWIAEVGEDYIVGLVEETRKGVADGTIPTFSDTGSFLQRLSFGS